jgi:hypothetical protein
MTQLLSIDNVLAHNPKGKRPDSDWLSLVWVITDIRTNQSVTRQATFHLGDNIGDNTMLNGPWMSGLLDVDQNHIVSIVIAITNLSSLDIEKQTEKAIELTINLAKGIAPLFFEAGTLATAIAAALITTAGAAVPAALGIASAVSGVLSQEADRIIDSVAGPILRSIAGFVEGIFGGEPVCDGEVLKNTLVIPGPDFQRLANGEQLSFTITGSQDNQRCGEAPTTTVNYSLGPASIKKFIKSRTHTTSTTVSLRGLASSAPSVRAFMAQ